MKALLFALIFSLGAALQAAEDSPPSSFDRSRLPPALRNVPLERLSSGALLRLDRDGDLVEKPEAWSARIEARGRSDSARPESVPGLDRRVGSNIRLGDDPPALPSNRRAQAEPHIARSPVNPDLLLATFQEGRHPDGGAVDCGYSLSRDGGLTWTRALIPNLTPASGGSYGRATDPVAGAAANGDLYLNTLGLTTGVDSQGQTETLGTVLVNRSTNGGNTFGAPLVAYRAPNNDVFADKNWMAVNTFPGTPSAGRVLVTFTLFSNVGGVSHPIMRAYSDNGGVNWSGAAFVHSQNLQVQGSQPVFLPDGRLAIIYWNFNADTGNAGDDFLELVVSPDGGVTFGAPKFITAVNYYDHPFIRDGGFLPSATTDRTVGHLYVAYQARHSGNPRIMFTKSTDAGNTWTTPIPISDNPAGSGVLNAAIAASPDGQTLTAVFYDLRDNRNSNTRVDLYLAQSFDGGATWQPNIRLTQVSTDAALAPNTAPVTNPPSAPSYMLGDYQGVAEPTNPSVPAVPVWIDTRTGNPDPFIARVGIAPSLDFTSFQAAHFSLGQINNPAQGGEAADPDGDGEDNRTEFMTATDPTNPASVVRTGSQLNISTRARIEPGDENVLIGGFIITGNAPKRVIVRAIGPSLTQANVPGALQNPTLQLVPASGPSTFNDNWQDSDAAAIQATGIPPGDSRESAIVQTLAPGAYTAVVRGAGNTAGVALVEVYDLAPANGAQLRNISSRGFVSLGDNVMIGGFIIGGGQGVNGAGSVRVVVRAIGPSLSTRGIANPLLDPELSLFNANGVVIRSNDNWAQTQQAEIQATGLAPPDVRESALVTGLPSGGYTAVVRGKNGTSGVGLIEVYHVD